jgi:dissimilatory sulfite reductase (desulfoviridin) alpha/beta subunit
MSEHERGLIASHEDEIEDDYMKSLESCPKVCPACSSDDLHSALLNGESAISCGGCVWIATIASFQADREGQHE